MAPSVTHMQTINQQLHHQEQMEALRRDFGIVWESELKPLALSFGITEFKELAAIEHAAWNSFRKNKVKNP